MNCSWLQFGRLFLLATWIAATAGASLAFAEGGGLRQPGVFAESVLSAEVDTTLPQYASPGDQSFQLGVGGDASGMQEYCEPLSTHPSYDGGWMSMLRLFPEEHRVRRRQAWKDSWQGEPLVGTSWRNRPYHVDFFIGGIQGDDPIDGRVLAGSGFIGGVRLGGDFNDHWGLELRYATTDIDMAYTTGPSARTLDEQFFDVHAMYYPWGDTRWRPYFSVGGGVAQFTFFDEQNRHINDSSLHLPIGAGIKYYWRPWAALRFDLHNNIALGGATVDFLNSVSFTAGVEWRFGGRRRSYYPYNPSIRLR